MLVGGRRRGAEERDARLLRTRRERSRRRASEERDEVATVHSMISLASRRNGSGIARPSAFAVLRFTTSSNLVGNWTGRSPGLAPLRMRSTYTAARRYASAKSTP